MAALAYKYTIVSCTMSSQKYFACNTFFWLPFKKYRNSLNVETKNQMPLYFLQILQILTIYLDYHRNI